jgi:hypothetical protein
VKLLDAVTVKQLQQQHLQQSHTLPLLTQHQSIP